MAETPYNEEVIDCPSYLVLDVPSPMAETIRDFRRRFDPARSAMPVEITLTGSCGTGLIRKGQSISRISELLDRAAEKIKPFEVAFDAVDRFSNTDIYFLTLKPSPELLEAQKIISESGIVFEPTPYPYFPHCTLILRKPVEKEQDLLELFFLSVPKEPFTLDLLSMYAMRDANTCDILYKKTLGPQ